MTEIEALKWWTTVVISKVGETILEAMAGRVITVVKRDINLVIALKTEMGSRSLVKK